MNITIDKCVVAKDGIRLGMRLEYFEGGPVRFFQGLIPWGLFTQETLDDLMRAQILLTNRWLDSEQDEADSPTLF